ncbi:thermonuclease family protein [Luteipulveratus halotolerans]|uniref:thermonuclease family protein n=1 Tax=Luteipulveratus halotolerans TaxID=1631356 RepID=UPI0006802C01|nr:thermonuclease family protein [Luteipulveratus halotolerans]
MTWVKGYTLKEGTPVRAHERRTAGGTAGLLAGALLVTGAAGTLTYQNNPTFRDRVKSWTGSANPGRAHTPIREGERHRLRVTRVLDGDTFRVRDDRGRDAGKVRVVGVDAPELAHDGARAQCYAKTATRDLRGMVDGRWVTVTTDPTQWKRDVYGRLLGYVSVEHGTTDVGAALIDHGSARAHEHGDIPTQRKAEYTARETTARARQAGRWRACS